MNTTHLIGTMRRDGIEHEVYCERELDGTFVRFYIYSAPDVQEVVIREDFCTES